jgi:hypothetical protein
LNNAPLPGDTSVAIVARDSGMYSVQIVDSNGCKYFSTPVVISSIKNVLGDNGRINIFPNPSFTGEWQVEVSAGLIGSACELFDAEGRKVYSGYLLNEKSLVSIKALPGVYDMKISSAEGSYKLVVVEF